MQASKQASNQTSNQSNKQTKKQRNKQTSKQVNKQTSKQSSKQAKPAPPPHHPRFRPPPPHPYHLALPSHLQGLLLDGRFQRPPHAELAPPRLTVVRCLSLVVREQISARIYCRNGSSNRGLRSTSRPLTPYSHHDLHERIMDNWFHSYGRDFCGDGKFSAQST